LTKKPTKTKKAFILSRTQNRIQYPVSQRREKGNKRKETERERKSKVRTLEPRSQNLQGNLLQQENSKQNFGEKGFKKNETTNNRIREAQSVARNTLQNTGIGIKGEERSSSLSLFNSGQHN